MNLKNIINETNFNRDRRVLNSLEKAKKNSGQPYGDTATKKIFDLFSRDDQRMKSDRDRQKVDGALVRRPKSIFREGVGLKEYYKEILNTLLSEDIETPLRNAENNKAIKNLEGKAKEKKRIWNKVSDPHSDLPPHSDSPEAYKASWNRRMTRAYKASDKFVAAREKLEARIALQQKEQASKFRIGLGGKRRKTK